MKHEYIDHQYFNSYYYSNIINNLINNRWDYLGFVSQFFEIEPITFQLKPWQKDSILHRFILYVIRTIIEDESYEQSVKQLNIAKLRGDKHLGQIYIEWIFENYKLKYFSFEEFCSKDLQSIKEDDFYDYYNELILCSDIENLYKAITEEVFYLIFSNRSLLLNFNLIISDYISDLNFDMFDDECIDNIVFLEKSGQLNRQSVPEWVKNAVYFRDRGKCCICKKDLSGLLSLSTELEYDHIVPLKQGGVNDVTNIQLLCKECNRRKGDKKIVTSSLYEKWY